MFIVSLNRRICHKHAITGYYIAHRCWSNFRRIFMSNFMDLPLRRKFYRIRRIWFDEFRREDPSPSFPRGPDLRLALKSRTFSVLSFLSHCTVIYESLFFSLLSSLIPHIIDWNAPRKSSTIYAETSDFFSFPLLLSRCLPRCHTKSIASREITDSRNSKGHAKERERERFMRSTSTERMRVIVAVQQRACSLGAIFVLGG